MDFALKLAIVGLVGFNRYEVSILVLVDFALKHKIVEKQREKLLGFNPCFGGFCS